MCFVSHILLLLLLSSIYFIPARVSIIQGHPSLKLQQKVPPFEAHPTTEAFFPQFTVTSALAVSERRLESSRTVFMSIGVVTLLNAGWQWPWTFGSLSQADCVRMCLVRVGVCVCGCARSVAMLCRATRFLFDTWHIAHNKIHPSYRIRWLFGQFVSGGWELRRTQLC